MRWLAGLAALALLGAGVFWVVTRPAALPRDALAGLSGDAGRGERIFLAAGCASCHTAPDDETEGPPLLAGGQRFPSDFGTFLAPNISPHPERGVGRWSDLDLLTAITRGVSPDGRHYYPAFPYTAYALAGTEDLADLIAYLRGLPESDTPSQPHDLDFPFGIRRGIGIWKALYAGRGWVLDDPADPEIARGRYLAEALAHCGECHTARDALGGLETDLWLSGAPNPSGKGTIPGIDPGHLDWSRADIAAYLTTGLTPDYDSAGDQMVAVIDKLAQLPEEDIAAITAYLDAVPAIDSADASE